MPYYATKDNAKLYYQIEGEGRPIVLIHGWSSTHNSYSGVIQILKNKYRCVSYSHRGHGASDVPEGGYTISQLARDLKELIDFLTLKDVILIGHSMGGHTVYEYIKQFGCENISKLVIIDMSPKAICDNEWKAGCFETYDAQSLKEDMEHIAQDVTQCMAKLILPDIEKYPAHIANFAVQGLKKNNHTLPLLGLWYSMFTKDYRSMLSMIEVPTAYIIPEHPNYPMSAANYVAEHASAPVKIIEAVGCTHICMIEDPVQTANHIVAFVEEKDCAEERQLAKAVHE